MAALDIHQRDDLAFPQSLPEFQKLFPNDAACAVYLGRARWPDGFVCSHCGVIGEPFRIATRPGVLECRACRRQTGLLAGTVMERSHTPLSVWFWAAYLVASQTPGMSAVQFQRQLGLTRYETAFGILHKLRAGMVRPDQDRIGGRAKEHVEVDETWSVEGRAAMAEASTTKHWCPPLSRFAIASRGRRKTSAGTVAMPVVCDWPSSPTAAPIPCAALSRTPSCQPR